jgi:hypothetical protein
MWLNQLQLSRYEIGFRNKEHNRPYLLQTSLGEKMGAQKFNCHNRHGSRIGVIKILTLLEASKRDMNFAQKCTRIRSTETPAPMMFTAMQSHQ